MKMARLHLSNFENVLRPRGSMQKESLGLYIKEKLRSNYNHFTNPEYDDNPPKDVLLNCLKRNAITEMMDALREFEAEVKNQN